MSELTLDNIDYWKEKNPRWWAVKLFEHEAEWIRKSGESRFKNARGNGFKNNIKEASNQRFDLLGVAGEFAVAMMLNLPINQIISTTKKELLSPDVGAFEVKTNGTGNPNWWNLLANHGQVTGKEKNIFINCIGALFPDYIIIDGWAFGHELIGGEEKMAHAGHKMHMLRWNKLKDPKMIFDFITPDIRKKYGDFKNPCKSAKE